MVLKFMEVNYLKTILFRFTLSVLLFQIGGLYGQNNNNRFNSGRYITQDTLIINAPHLDSTTSISYNYAGLTKFVSIDVLKSAQQTILTEEGIYYRLYLSQNQKNKINFYFKNVVLTKGSYLYFLIPEINYSLGPFNESNPLKATSFLPDNKVIIEVFVSKESEENTVVIEEIGFKNIEAEIFQYKNSGSCMVNVNCAEGEKFQDQKRGVAKMIIKNGNLLFNCSGTLLNNTQQDKKPYFLTASHCIDQITSDKFDEIIFDFNYEYSDCEGFVEIGPNTLVGSSLLSESTTNGGSDFALLLLNDTVPSSYGVFYNGWSTLTSNLNEGVSIHHPKGDRKKISTYNDPLSAITINNGIQNGYWGVNWTQTSNGFSVTEPGSSGSPIFNKDGLVVGSLSGGQASCSNLNGKDAYGRFDYHYSRVGTDSENRLMDWLDPTNTGILSIKGLGNGPITEPDTNFYRGQFKIEILNNDEIGNTFFQGNNLILEISTQDPGNYYIQLIELGSGKYVYNGQQEIKDITQFEININKQISSSYYLLRVYNSKQLVTKKIYIYR
jgi:hypothetical protein